MKLFDVNTARIFSRLDATNERVEARLEELLNKNLSLSEAFIQFQEKYAVAEKNFSRRAEALEIHINKQSLWISWLKSNLLAFLGLIAGVLALVQSLIR